VLSAIISPKNSGHLKSSFPKNFTEHSFVTSLRAADYHCGDEIGSVSLCSLLPLTMLNVYNLSGVQQRRFESRWPSATRKAETT
jgi:hypothetical protein